MRKIIAILLIGLALAAPVHAQSGGGYDLTWNTIDGGGMMEMTGGEYSLSGTIGQHDAGPIMAASSYTLSGGFWANTLPYGIYLPVVIKT